MFFIKKFLIFIAFIALFFVNNKAKEEEIIIIPESSLRFRVIANSNSFDDYVIKNRVKESLEIELTELLSSAKSLQETKDILNDNLLYLNNTVSKELSSNDFKVNLGYNYFPEKTYKGVVYPEGEYDSLVVTIGKGKGENWWCVLFPPLCLLDTDRNTNDVEYKFYVSRILDYFK